MATTRDDSTAGSIARNTSRSITKKMDLLDKKMDNLYKDVYISRPDNKNNLDDLIDNMDNVIDKLHGVDITSSGMTELLRRVENKNRSNSDQLINDVTSLFNDQTLIGTLFANQDMHKYIAGQNYNYDLICKYLPRLQDALEIKRDNVLCSDNFSKSFLNPKSSKTSKEEVEKFANNVKKIEDEYEISDFLEETYMRTSKYGEDFIYIVPYNIAFKRLLDKSNRRLTSQRPGQVSLFESYSGSTHTILKEGWESSKDFVEYAKSTNISKDIYNSIPEMHQINIHFNKTNVITSTVNEYCILKDKKDLDQFKSLSEAYFGTDDNIVEEANSGDSGLTSMFDKLQKRNNKISYPDRSMVDGLILPNSYNRDPNDIDDDYLGAVLERLPRENIMPVYIGKRCLGYYYFEFAEDPDACGFCGGHHSLPIGGVATSKLSYDMLENQQELTMRYIASRISQSIDTKFINANKDLKEDIYAILNYNDKFDITRTNDIGVTFIPADDIIHTYFKLDERAHRGISDLQGAVVPAMLYILLYLTDIIGKITRGVDKRVYYVKQNVETNIARTMMNVVGQIKKGNFGMRQIESMNNILNIVGKYNDYIIPVGPSGDPPINFEVMQGQNIETPTDLMDKMEEAAVNTIIPYEFVNATYQQDFATRFTMSNTRFLKSIYTRQRKVENFFSKIYTKIYNYEFGETNAIIKVTLPPPTYLTMNNNSQLIDNINQMADKIIDSELDKEADDVKNEFKKLYLREHLSSYIDFATVERLLSTSRVNVEANRIPQATEADPNELANDDF